MYGCVRVAAASPKLAVADCKYNKEEILKSIFDANERSAEVLVFPELSLSGYTCGDLFYQNTLLEACEIAVSEILNQTAELEMVIALGTPIYFKNSLYNCAVIIQRGKILGIVPKTHLPNYSEFYEKRWFSSALDLTAETVTYCGQTVPMGKNLIFQCTGSYALGVEICEDLWSPIPPSSFLSTNGASIILNLSASNELATKEEYRKNLISMHSAATISGYVYASSSIYESTQDTVFSGHCLIYENGTCLKESSRFSQDNQLIMADIDVELLENDRMKNTTFTNGLYGESVNVIVFDANPVKKDTLERKISPFPFVPGDNEHLEKRCDDIFNIQLTGLARRFSHTRSKTMVLGISGGLDSTLALLVAAKACDYLKISRKSIIGITMPGFGTTDRTYNNALALMKALGITTREISIKAACIQHFKDIGHDSTNHDVTYENTQARERTQILMDIANMENGLVVGTGDLSELALGWATYNGDHMSMYGVNAGVPKTLVRVLVNYIASTDYLEKEARDILKDVLDTPVSPELLPPDENGDINQKTEDIVGPYELHDFFLYYVMRHGFNPDKILKFALIAFQDVYTKDIIVKWLRNFYGRFFSQQFKRSCLPDGPKVGTISLSPRSDWRMPSDAVSRLWLDEVEQL